MIGVDICSTSRCLKIFDKYGERFLTKYLHEIEKNHFKMLSLNCQKQQFLASRWAAKEATYKALSLMSHKRISLPYTDIEIRKSSNQVPCLIFHNQSENILQMLGVKDLHLTISHETSLAIAFVLLRT